MNAYQLGAVESRFADIIWENAPLSSAQLVTLSEQQLQWKKSTTYTVLKRLCEKGIFKNEKGTVTALITRDDFYCAQSEKFVEDTFGGSLPAFLAAFTKRKKLSADEVQQLRKMVDEFGEG
ncbi:MAG: BlaI/MecI/CopY family transcriptional regulator [Ruminococcaceae bacterium]|nr:BlaI/MecI/CopY family transcriptional regulator [Oscillospiraceae bacterium]